MALLCDRSGCLNRVEAKYSIEWKGIGYMMTGKIQKYPVCEPCKDILWPIFLADGAFEPQLVELINENK